jgi:hypothetical protein
MAPVPCSSSYSRSGMRLRLLDHLGQELLDRLVRDLMSGLG